MHAAGKDVLVFPTKYSVFRTQYSVLTASSPVAPGGANDSLPAPSRQQYLFPKLRSPGVEFAGTRLMSFHKSIKATPSLPLFLCLTSLTGGSHALSQPEKPPAPAKWLHGLHRELEERK